jgi:hypothetical protein
MLLDCLDRVVPHPGGPEAAKGLQAGLFLVGQIGRLVLNPGEEHVMVIFSLLLRGGAAGYAAV